ncbi:MAG: secretin N-terminal domain-containing protein [Planctomycetaceae bacterium]
MARLPMLPLRARLWTRRRGFYALLVFALVAPIAFAQPGLPGEYQSHPLKHKSPEDVKRLVAELLTDYPDVDVVADGRSHQILVRGPAKAQQIVSQLIESVDRPSVPRPQQKPTVKAYACPRDRLQEVAEAVRKDFADEKAVRIATDAETEQLFVLASPDVHAAVEARLRRIGIGVEPAAGDRSTGLPITADDGSNSSLESRVERTEATRPRLTKPVELYVPLAYTDTARIEKSLGELFEARLQAAEAEPGTFLVSGAAGQRVTLRGHHPRARRHGKPTCRAHSSTG